MSSPLHADIELGPEGPVSRQYQDRYFGRVGPLVQARAVFIDGNALDTRGSSASFLTIVETGFGLGFNFLATWAYWREKRFPAPLHFVSIEAHPVDLVTLSRAHHAVPEIESLARELRLKLPPPRPGVHRLHFDDGHVTLTLIYGHDVEALNTIDYVADAIYLDGFAPDKNPALWSSPVLETLFAHARPGTTLATWCAQGQMRRRLKAAGFVVTPGPGLGEKRETTRAHVPGVAVSSSPPKELTIVGAGLVGTALCTRALAHGLSVHLIDAAPGPGTGASGNPAGVVRPVFNQRPSITEDFSLDCFDYALRDFADSPFWHPTGVLHLAKSTEEWENWRQRFDTSPVALPDTCQLIPPALLKTRFAIPIDRGALLFPRGGYAEPGALCRARLQGLAGPFRHRFNTIVNDVECHAGAWRLHTQNDVLEGDGPLVFATGAGFGAAKGHDFLPPDYRDLARQRGEITTFKIPFALPYTLSGEGYVTPMADGEVTVGATYDREIDHTLTAAGVEENRQRFSHLTGHPSALQVTGGRAAWRSIAADRLPIVGADPSRPQVWHCRAMASRGLVWHALSAELLISALIGAPRPLARSLVDRLSPDRALLKLPASRPGSR